MAVDVVGYARLMGRDESGTRTRLREHRKKRFEPVLARYGRPPVKLTGDGALVEFASAVDALGAAIEFQQAMIEANRRSAEYVHRTIKDARPADLRVERPTKLQLSVNLATAKASGVTVPPAILAGADEVIE
jgi:class 3 adenylate cyclase